MIALCWADDVLEVHEYLLVFTSVPSVAQILSSRISLKCLELAQRGLLNRFRMSIFMHCYEYALNLTYGDAI